MATVSMKFIRTFIASHRLAKALEARKAVRLVEQQRASKAYWQAQRKIHASDPLWRRSA